MKKKILTLLILFICSLNLLSQNGLTQQQKYFLSELNDAYGGQIFYANNYHKTAEVYQKLVKYTGMRFPVVFNQTFHWGEAHYGGLIILDYSTINKNRDILAFVFAHEWAHQALGHQPNLYKPNGSLWKVKTSSTQYEDEADFYAGQFLSYYNYNINAVTNYLNALPDFDDKEHSSGKERAKTVLRGYNSSKQKLTDDFRESTPTYRSVFNEEFDNNANNWKVGRDYKKSKSPFDNKMKTTNSYYKIKNGKYSIKVLGDYGQGGIGKKQLVFNSNSSFEISSVIYLYSGGFTFNWDSCEGEKDSNGWFTNYINYIYLKNNGDYTIGHHNKSIEWGNTEKTGKFSVGKSNRIYLRIVYQDGICKYYLNNDLVHTKSVEVCGNGADFKVDTGTDIEIENILILRKNQ